MRRVYFDHNASTPVHPEVIEAMLPLMRGDFGNPSSPNWFGVEAAGHLKRARERVASLIHARPEEVIFTSSGSEGDNMAIMGTLIRSGRGGHIITTAVEHPAVYNTCLYLQNLGYEVTFIEVDGTGIVDPDDIKAAVRKETALISVMLANNETGSINPVKDISSIAREHGVILHTDAVQAVGKIPIDVKDLGVDVLTASGHKYNAPKGVGFQYVRDGIKLAPLLLGGRQEMGLRAGTENLPGIVALGKASALAEEGMQARAGAIGELRDRLQEGLMRMVPETVLNGHPTRRIYNTLNMSFKYIEADALQGLLDIEGIALSTGSACASGTSEPSRILTAMGLEPVTSRGALRFSLGMGNTEEDVEYCLEVLPPLAMKLQRMSPLHAGY
jgi:cysteine desulfurase